jgi:hypothetical protein
MASLFSAVGAKHELRMVERFRTTLEAAGKIQPNALSLLSDLILCPENGHNISASQQIWVNSSVSEARVLAHAAATVLWVGERLIVKEEFRPTENWPPEVTAMSCLRCGTMLAARREVERVAATIWAALWVRGLIEGGHIDGAIREALDCVSCFSFVRIVEEILGEKNIRPVDDDKTTCPSCGGRDIAYSLVQISWETARNHAKKLIV